MSFKPREILKHWSLWLGGLGTALAGFFMLTPQIALYVWASLPWWISAKVPERAGYVVTFVLLVLAIASKFIPQKVLIDWLLARLAAFGRAIGGSVRKAVAGGLCVLALSGAGASFVMLHEGMRTTAYRDVAGIWTICVGHTGRVVIAGVDYGMVRADLTLTKDQCKVLLQQDSDVARAILNGCVRVPLNQNQSDTLISFTINIGPRVCASTTVKMINAGQFLAAADALLLWKNATVDGVLKPVLLKRRQAERALFLSPVRSANDNTADNLTRLAKESA